MKDSGSQWIGMIPEHWSIGPFKHSIQQNDGGVWGEDPNGADDKIVLRSTEQTVDGKWCIENPATRNLSGVSRLDYFMCREGDLLLTKSSGSDLHIGKTTIVSEEVESMHCYYSNFIQRVRVKPGEYPKFYWYILNSDLARSQFAYFQNSTSGIGNLNAGYIDNLTIPIVPVDEQRRIAAFLDTECAKIDNVLAQTRASIEDYIKLKQAVITQAVTKGIHPEVKVVPSSVEWFSEIADSVKVSRISRHFNIILGKMICSEQTSPDMELYPYFCAANVHFDGADSSDLKKMWFSSSEIEQYTVRIGDLLVVEGGAGAGGCAIVEGISETIGVQNSIQIVRPIGNDDSRFLCYLIQCLVKKKYVDVVCNKATIPHFTKEKLGSMPYLLWPVEEQKAIADFLDKRCSEIDSLVEKKKHFITELENYKKSLIYEYVTGKKEVPQA